MIRNTGWKNGDRNRKCYCGSGIKYKFCHYLIEKDEQPLKINDKKKGIIANPKAGKKLLIKR